MELHVVNIMHPKDFKNSQFFYNLLYTTRLHQITYKEHTQVHKQELEHISQIKKIKNNHFVSTAEL